MNVRLLAAMWFAATAVLPPGASAQPRSDEGIAQAVAGTVRQAAQLTIFDHVSGRVDQRAVTLTGKVTTREKKKTIEERVAAIAGVADLRSEITVLPGSPADDDLRYRISRAIYGNPSFWSYAAMPSPPIHIIVENGHVTLAGTVNSNAERAMARSLASSQAGTAVTNDLQVGAGSDAAVVIPDTPHHGPPRGTEPRVPSTRRW